MKKSLEKLAQTYSDEEHPFAHYIRLLGKGKNGSRSLTFEEAQDAFDMILSNKVEELQLGAFLMLLRVKEETPDELAGFVAAVQAHFTWPATAQVDLDWSSYAGKKHHSPWFVLALLLLASNGIRTVVHGASQHTARRMYTEHTFRELGLPICTQPESLAAALDTTGIAYIPLTAISPVLDNLLRLRNILGLRSPVNTLARLLNPCKASASVQSVFHPGYLDKHQHAARLLGYAHTAVFKGESGEAEIRPDANTRICLQNNGHLTEVVWPRVFPDPMAEEDAPDIALLREVWAGTSDHAYGIAAIVATAGVALLLMGRADSPTNACTLAEKMWQNRAKDVLPT